MRKDENKIFLNVLLNDDENLIVWFGNFFKSERSKKTLQRLGLIIESYHYKSQYKKYKYVVIVSSIPNLIS
jgi:hypothetical protein